MTSAWRVVWERIILIHINLSSTARCCAWCWWSCVRLSNNCSSRIENGKDQQLCNEWINISWIFFGIVGCQKLQLILKWKLLLHTLLAFVKNAGKLWQMKLFELHFFVKNYQLFRGSRDFFEKLLFKKKDCLLDVAKNPGNHELVVIVNKGLSFIIRVFSKVRKSRHQ